MVRSLSALKGATVQVDCLANLLDAAQSVRTRTNLEQQLAVSVLEELFALSLGWRRLFLAHQASPAQHKG
jgi:hypothetical protein